MKKLNMHKHQLTVIILASDICIGPNNSFAGKRNERRVKLIIFAIANRPSEILCGSKACQKYLSVIEIS